METEFTWELVEERNVSNKPQMVLKINKDRFKRSFQLSVRESKSNTMVFEMIGITAPVVNGIRRILLSSIPTMAINDVYITTNTSNLKDEVLSHRLGLIPIYANANDFDFPSESEPSDMDTITFQLKVICPRDQTDNRVYSGHLQWIPQGNQTGDIRPLHNNIVIAHLRPGQELDVYMTCIKGIGKDNAKWTPVETVSFQPASKRDDHFTFSITSRGTSPDVLLNEAIRILLNSNIFQCVLENR